MSGRDFVLPDDVKLFAHASLTHRLILEPDMWTDKAAADDVVAELVRMVAVPVTKASAG